MIPAFTLGRCRNRLHRHDSQEGEKLVGTAGFEPATLCSQIESTTLPKYLMFSRIPKQGKDLQALRDRARNLADKPRRIIVE